MATKKGQAKQSDPSNSVQVRLYPEFAARVCDPLERAIAGEVLTTDEREWLTILRESIRIALVQHSVVTRVR